MTMQSHRYFAALLICALSFLPCIAQQRLPQSKQPAAAQALDKNPELLAAFGKLYERLQREVRLPEPRSQSRILALMPAPTTMYAAIPNYGEAASQAVAILRQERQQNSALRDWWSQGDMKKNGPRIEAALEKYSQLAQYLGEEMVISGTVENPGPKMVLVAEIRKPGAKGALQDLANTLAEDSKPGVRILEESELAALPETAPAGKPQDFLFLVRPDYLVGAPDAATLRAFNDRLKSGSNGEFAATPFGQRVSRAYQDGITTLVAADLQSMIRQARSESKSKDKQDMAALDRTGFSDVQYLVWEHRRAGAQDLSESELSFLGPRHGIAAWLGTPKSLGSLDFVSAKPVMTLSLVLANPAQIYDDLHDLATASNPNAFAMVQQTEQQLNLSLRDDLLRLLGGEITIDVDSISPSAASWKAILRVSDPVHLQQTIGKLLATMPAQFSSFEQGGVTYHVIRSGATEAPQGSKPAASASEWAYAFVDGYLVVASSAKTAAEAVRLHRSGESLGKSQKFQAALPPGHPGGISALLYEDPVAMTATQMQKMAPQAAGQWAQLAGGGPPLVLTAYGEANAIRGASTSTAMDAGVIAIVAAVAIPNLLKSRSAANEASAVGSLRTINVAQVTYASTYPARGFAMNLGALGAAPGGTAGSAEHAGLIDESLGCSSGDWCVKAGYRFRVNAVCLQGQCAQYVALATPVNASTGTRNFCSTSDGVIRFQAGPPLNTPIGVPECRRWAPLK